MAKKEDLRITRTKSALTNAFFAILEETSFDDMTVNLLCERAGVRRATFYTHFKDKNDFLLYLMRTVRDRFDKKRESISPSLPFTTKYYIDYAEELLNFFFSHETAMLKILNSSMRTSVIEIFVKQNFEDTKKRLDDSVKSGMSLPTSVDTLANMLIGGISNNIVYWFESKNDMPYECLIAEITVLIERIFN